MKFTQILYKIHIGKATRYLWQHQRERPIIATDAERILKSMNASVEDATEVVSLQKDVVPFKPTITEPKCNVMDTCKAVVSQDTKSYLSFEDHNVLQEGVSQTCLLINTLKVDDDLPKKVEDLITDIPNSINNLIRKFIYTSVIYDAEQVKLPRLKDSARPAWNFPRVYGISTKRKVYNLSKKFAQLCESLHGLSIAQSRSILNNAISCVCIDNAGDLIRFYSTMDVMMTSSLPLTPVADVNMLYEYDMPNIYPMHPTIGLLKVSDIKTEEVYPVNVKSPFANVHTIVISNDSEKVKNITELPVTEDQIHGRSMIKSFTIAAACARQRFGSDVKDLPEPIVVQCIQTDGQSFHFSVYQLNTLNFDAIQDKRNFWWSKPSIKLYDKAQYENGQPCLEGYNEEVFKNFLAFYRNE